MPYFIISNSDGDTSVDPVTKEELIKRITPEEGEGENYYGNCGFLSKIDDIDTNYWGDNILIIKGEIIAPRPKEIVKTFDVE